MLDALDWITRDLLALRRWMRQRANHILGLRLAHEPGTADEPCRRCEPRQGGAPPDALTRNTR